MDYNKAFKILRSYFASGWAFLIPYVVAFLIYYKFKLPLSIAGPSQFVPTLLHIYWCIHIINLVLAFFAIYSFRRGAASKIPTFSSQLLSIAPWALLALTFYIPGTYLEFPSDPWEHLARITHWADSNTLQTLYKSFGYSIPYSFVCNSSSYVLFLKLDIYTTGICLLLCWQYYRLGRAVGLSDKYSLIFVLIQSITLGNSAFSFYKYYALASTIYSQIAAIALIILALEIAQSKNYSLETNLCNGTNKRWRLLKILICGSCLILLISLNHIQGLGISGLGLTAIGIWRLLKWRRSMFIWLVLIIIILTFGMKLWFHENPIVNQEYVRSGLINKWYGFNIISSNSIALERIIQILGIFGILNLTMGLMLISRNNVAGWLTVTPVITLLLPFAALPFIKFTSPTVIKSINLSDILAFNRMLLEIPSGLAIIYIFKYFILSKYKIYNIRGGNSSVFNPRLVLIFILAIFTTLPNSTTIYNRLWNSLEKVPDDLSMKNLVRDIIIYSYTHSQTDNSIWLTSSDLGFIIYSVTNITTTMKGRNYHDWYSNTTNTSSDIKNLSTQILPTLYNKNIMLPEIIWSKRYSSTSFGSLNTNHWLAQEAILQPINPSLFHGIIKINILENKSYEINIFKIIIKSQ